MSKPKLIITERKIEGGGKQYDFRCPYPDGCGTPGGEGFSSIGWSDREHAVARAKQHKAEHEEGATMPSLAEFRTARGLTAETAGAAVKPIDWEF